MIALSAAVFLLLWTLGLLDVLFPRRPPERPKGSLLTALLEQIPFTVTEDEP